MTLDEVNITDICLLPINSSCSKIYSIVDYVLYCVAISVVILTVCGNLLVVVAVYHFKELHTPTNVLILSLAISDCFVGLIVMPIYSVTIIDSCSLFVSNFCSFYNIINYQLTCVSICNIVLIAIDRYFALSNPFLYSKTVSLSLACTVVIIVWMVSLSYNCVLLYFNGNFTRKCPGKCPPYVDEVWAFADLMFVFILPCATIIILYLKVFFIARRHAVQIREAFKDRKRLDVKNSDNPMRLERKAARVLGILVSVFLACLIPYYVCSMLFDVLAESYEYVVNITLTFFLLNSTINPIIYALFFSWFQKSLKRILTFQICMPDSSLINVVSSDS